MNLPPPPQHDDPIITQFEPRGGQWELNDDNIQRIDPRTGHTILHNYCHHINTTPLEVWRYLIKTKGCNVNVQDNHNDTPLHKAFFYFNPNGDIAVLMYLLTQTNTNVNTKGYNGETLLHLACQHLNYLPLDIFKVLIEKHGCDVNVQNKDNNTPLHRALRYFNPNDGGDIKVLHYLLSQKGVNANIKGWNGYTILHWACNNINNLPLDVFKLLIETHGADVNVQDKSNNTPAYLAFREFQPRNGGDINVLTYLLNQNNVNLNIQNEEGRNLLHTTCINTLPSNRCSVELDAEYDTVFCQIVEVIAERCIQQVLDETTS
jgi:ankyrin repeat protein